MDAVGRRAMYLEKVQALDASGVRRMCQVVFEGGNLVGWPPGRALEYLILRAFQLEGADVTWLGAVFSTGTFTEPAIRMTELLAPQDVLLWEGEELSSAIAQGALRDGMRRKLRYAVENGFVSREPSADRSL